MHVYTIQIRMDILKSYPCKSDIYTLFRFSTGKITIYRVSGHRM